MGGGGEIGPPSPFFLSVCQLRGQSWTFMIYSYPILYFFFFQVENVRFSFVCLSLFVCSGFFFFFFFALSGSAAQNQSILQPLTKPPAGAAPDCIYSNILCCLWTCDLKSRWWGGGGGWSPKHSPPPHFFFYHNGVGVLSSARCKNVRGQK